VGRSGIATFRRFSFLFGNFSLFMEITMVAIKALRDETPVVEQGSLRGKPAS